MHGTDQLKSTTRADVPDAIMNYSNAIAACGGIMFIWDLEKKTIILSEGSIKREYSYAEWLALIHEDDLDYHKNTVRAFLQDTSILIFVSEYRLLRGGKHIKIKTVGKRFDTNSTIVTGIHIPVVQGESGTSSYNEVDQDPETRLLAEYAFKQQLVQKIDERYSGRIFMRRATDKRIKVSALILIQLFNYTEDIIPLQAFALDILGDSCLQKGDIVGHFGSGFFYISIDLPDRYIVDDILCRIDTRVAEAYPKAGFLYNTIVTFLPDLSESNQVSNPGANEIMNDAFQRIQAIHSGLSGFSLLHIDDPQVQERVLNNKCIRENLRLVSADNITNTSGLFPNYQPLYDAQGGVVGFEALARMKDVTGVMSRQIFPNEFIPLAEKEGYIGKIGDCMMRFAIQQIATWKKAGIDPLPNIAVNVSMIQLEDPGFYDRITGFITSAGIPPSSITLEVTESMAFQGQHSIVEVLQKFQSLGVQIALDDFGTGETNLMRVISIPFDKLKLDISFVRRLEKVEDPGYQDALLICQLIIDFAKKLGKKVVAEGIETQGQLDTLKSLGCDYFQGYLLSRPLGAEKLSEIIK